MKLKISNNKLLTVAAFVFVMGLLISIIPIIISSFYAHPLYDDFGFSQPVRYVVQNGGGLFKILSAAVQQAKDTYFNWQGTYAAIFIFSLQPAAFSENLYFLTTIVMLTALVLSTMFLINTVFHALGYDKKYGIIISCVILLLSIHFVVNKHEAFFWWNGSSYYTLFYSFSLLLFSLLIKMYYTDQMKKRICFFVLSVLLSAIIAGGNYSTTLITAVIFVCFLLMVFLYKRRILPYYFGTFIVFLTGFVISMLAPGNSVRASYVTGEPPIQAILYSVYRAVVFISKWTGLAQLAGFVLIAVIAFLLTRHSKYQFKYPLAVLIITFLIFATQLTPPLYAMNKVGAGRQVDIYYYSYYLLITFNIFYSCGWLNRKSFISFDAKKIKPTYVLCSLLVLLGVFLCGCLSYGVHAVTFIDTLSALNRGTPQAYSREYLNNIKEIKNGNTTISEMKTVPDFFAPLLIEENPDFWINKQIARYYDVDKIMLKTEQ